MYIPGSFFLPLWPLSVGTPILWVVTSIIVIKTQVQCHREHMGFLGTDRVINTTIDTVIKHVTSSQVLGCQVMVTPVLEQGSITPHGTL